MTSPSYRRSGQFENFHSKRGAHNSLTLLVLNNSKNNKQFKIEKENINSFSPSTKTNT